MKTIPASLSMNLTLADVVIPCRKGLSFIVVILFTKMFDRFLMKTGFR